MDISVVIPNYNGRDLMIKNIPHVLSALEGYKDGKSELIVVDDCSPDDSIPVIEDVFKKHKSSRVKLILLKNTVNGGFSKTVNKGVASAMGDVVVLLNSDTIPERQFLKPLLAHFSDPDVFAVGCMDKSIEADGSTELKGRGLGAFGRGFFVHKKGDVNKTNTMWVSGGSGAFRKSIWDKLGGLDILFSPYYWEDIDLSYRAIKSGYKVLFEPKSVVLHEHEKGAIKSTQKARHVEMISLRNQILFNWKNITDPGKVLSNKLWLPYYFIRSLFSGDLLFYISFFNALKLYGQMKDSAKKAQKLFVKSDTQVIATASS